MFQVVDVVSCDFHGISSRPKWIYRSKARAPVLHWNFSTELLLIGNYIDWYDYRYTLNRQFSSIFFSPLLVRSFSSCFGWRFSWNWTVCGSFQFENVTWRTVIWQYCRLKMKWNHCQHFAKRIPWNSIQHSSIRWVEQQRKSAELTAISSEFRFWLRCAKLRTFHLKSIRSMKYKFQHSWFICFERSHERSFSCHIIFRAHHHQTMHLILRNDSFSLKPQTRNTRKSGLIVCFFHWIDWITNFIFPPTKSI